MIKTMRYKDWFFFFIEYRANVEHFWRLAGINLNWPGNYQIVLSHYGLVEQLVGSFRAKFLMHANDSSLWRGLANI